MTIRLAQEQFDAMVKLQQWLDAMPDWFDLGSYHLDQISEVEQDAMDTSDCDPAVRDDFGEFYMEDGKLFARFYVQDDEGALSDRVEEVLPR